MTLYNPHAEALRAQNAEILHILSTMNSSPEATEAAQPPDSETDPQSIEADSVMPSLADKLAAVRLEVLTLPVNIRTDVDNSVILLSQGIMNRLGTDCGDYVLVCSCSGSTLLKVDTDTTCQAEAILNKHMAQNLDVNATEYITIQRAEADWIRRIAIFPLSPGQISNRDSYRTLASYFKGSSRPVHKGDIAVAQVLSGGRFVQFQVVGMANTREEMMKYGIVDSNTIFHVEDKVLPRDSSGPRHRQQMVPIPSDQLEASMSIQDEAASIREGSQGQRDMASPAPSHRIIDTELSPSNETTELPPPPYNGLPADSGCMADPAEYHADKDDCNMIQAQSAVSEAVLLQLVDKCQWDSGRVAMVKALQPSAVSKAARLRLFSMCQWDDGCVAMEEALPTTG